MSPLVTSEIFRLFVNTLTPMTSIPIAISRFSAKNFKRLYLKKKTHFFRFLIAFLKCAWNLEHSENKEEYSSLIIPESIPSEKDVYLSV